MSALTLQNRIGIDTLEIPGYFVDRFLPYASGTDIKVYLYLLRAVTTLTQGISCASIADCLDLTQKEVLRSLSSWEKAGLMRLSFTSQHELCAIEFTDPSPAQSAEAAASFASANALSSQAAVQAARSGQSVQPVQSVQSVQSIQTAQMTLSQYASSLPDKQQALTDTGQPATQPVAQPESPVTSLPLCESSLGLTTQEQALLDNDPDFALYMSAWQQYFPQPFTYSDTERIGYWYIKFNRSVEIIDYLVDYCATRECPNTRYLDKVAMAWHSKGLHTLNDIKAHNQICSSTAYAVMKAYGLYNQKPAPYQLECIERWVNEYGFSTELLVLACTRTIEYLQRPDMKYTEGILRDWKSKSIHSTADAQADSQQHSSQKKPASKQSAASSKSAWQFHNFTERTNNNYTEKILKQYRQ